MPPGSGAYAERTTFDRAGLWLKSKPLLGHLDIELTERCNNDCIHCCINLPMDDRAAQQREMTTDEVKGILTEAAAVRRKFVTGGWLFGAWVGLVIGVKLISLSVRRRRTDYEPDRGDCFACARCFEFCPNELVRRGLMPAAVPASGGAGNLSSQSLGRS
jgi:NAD-dependent dihydropyrimidine dehydrogenase PreA subunit